MMMHLDIVRYPHLVKLIKEAIMAPVPPGWEVTPDGVGNVIFKNRETGETLNEHPMDNYYRQEFA